MSGIQGTDQAMTQTAFLPLKKAELILCHMYWQRCSWTRSCAGTWLFPSSACSSEEASLLQGHSQSQLSLSVVSIKSPHWNFRPSEVWPQFSTPQHKPLNFKQLNLPMWHDWAKRGKKGSGSASNLMKLSGSKLEHVQEANKVNKKRKKKVKKKVKPKGSIRESHFHFSRGRTAGSPQDTALGSLTDTSQTQNQAMHTEIMGAL